MNKQDLIDAVVAAHPNLTKKATGEILNTALDAIGDALAKDDTVQLIGFGTFYVGKREARTGRNPRTGVELKIAASNTPKFKSGKVLKDKLN